MGRRGTTSHGGPQKFRTFTYISLLYSIISRCRQAMSDCLSVINLVSSTCSLYSTAIGAITICASCHDRLRQRIVVELVQSRFSSSETRWGFRGRKLHLGLTSMSLEGHNVVRLFTIERIVVVDFVAHLGVASTVQGQ
jgi:hypothetical protein